MDSVKAVLLKQITTVSPKEPNSSHHLGNHCLDSPNCNDVAIAYDKRADIEPNSAEAFVHLSSCYRSKEDLKEP